MMFLKISKAMCTRTGLAATVCSFALALTACTTPPSDGADANTQYAEAKSAPLPTPAQIAVQVCPPMQTAMSGLNALVGLPEGAQKDLAIITPIVADVCTVGATVNADNLQQLEQTALPAMIKVVKASALSVEEQNAVIVDVTAAQLILTGVSQAQANLSTSASH